ncbi:MAG: hypothetical protein F6K55_31105 [Moorea sp. SIO4A3]|nr:hypothetical protein [Moorena sp. SIO4A3]
MGIGERKTLKMDYQLQEVSTNALITTYNYYCKNSNYDIKEIHNEADKPQSLGEVATEIEQLLNQLSQTNSISTTNEKMVIVTKVAEQIENNPTLKSRVVGALKSGGTEAFKESINHPLVNILVAIIEGWVKAY